MTQDPDRRGTGYIWRAAPPPQAPTVTPAQLALQAFNKIVLPNPKVYVSPGDQALPDGRPYTVVRIPTWFWTDPASYRPLSARADAGAVWAEVTARPAGLTFAPGDGADAVACDGPGRAWTTSDGDFGRAPGGCDYAYPKSSLGVGANNMVTATMGIQWEITWTGSGGTSGNFGALTSTSNRSFAVAEAQAVISR